MGETLVSDSFDDLRSRHVRFLEEAAKLGPLRVLLWSDEAVRRVTGRPPKFPQAERHYLLASLRFVSRVELVDEVGDLDELPGSALPNGAAWVVSEQSASLRKEAYCRRRGLSYRVIGEERLQGFPIPPLDLTPSAHGRKKVVVTGCYDWLHSGHVRFFEEASTYGDLYVVVGHDANVRLLKGEGHPLFPQDERRYMVQAVRFVKGTLLTSGTGWLDAAAEIELIRADIYLVNEDGDRPEKRAFCASRGLEYVVLERKPKEGLPRRESTHLRGF